MKILSITAGAGGMVTMSLTRNGVIIVGAPIAEATLGAGAKGQLSLRFLDTEPAGAHHYGWTATVSASTISVDAGAASIYAREL